MTHPVYTHPNGEKCVWLEDQRGGGGWFIPYDVGGEGTTCPKRHPTDSMLVPRAPLEITETLVTLNPRGPSLTYSPDGGQTVYNLLDDGDRDLVSGLDRTILIATLEAIVNRLYQREEDR